MCIADSLLWTQNFQEFEEKPVNVCLHTFNNLIDRLFGIVISTSDCHPGVPGSIPGYTLEIFLEWGPPSLLRTIG